MSSILKKSGKEIVRSSADSPKTLIARAKREISGFTNHFAKFEEQVPIGGYFIGKQSFSTCLKNQIVYAQRPFSCLTTVVEYLTRSTHKVGISNHKSLEVGNEKVHFHCKDDRKGAALSPPPFAPKQQLSFG